MSELSQHDEKDCQMRQYIRRPDKQFWLDLLSPPPLPTQADHTRRTRITRYSLGAAFALTTFYFLLSFFLGFTQGLSVILLNAVTMACYGMGMWAASLHAERLARLWLMVTVNTHLAVLIFLTGSALGVSIFGVTNTVLASVIFDPPEKKSRLFFMGFPILCLILGACVFTQAYVDLSAVQPMLISLMRTVNMVLATLSVLLILNVFDREVLKAEQYLVQERERSDRLLHAVLPPKIANELRQNDRMIADRHPEVSVLFADIAGFTPWASKQDPEVVVSLLEKIFSRFDAIVARLGAEKIKTIGDAYMVVSGAPDPRHDHTHIIARLALALLDEIKLIRQETGIDLDVRIGVHTGSVIAGVIGAMRFSYDIWGDTVNTASRMESHGQAGRIQISQETRIRLAEDFKTEYRGVIDVKGKGEMATWWLLAQ
ncbi:class 3 adenylate cyclase [Agitococcus lubricus]|uniref:Adenylate cyclase n=2 Tax=Agitococcus lubricus TaxID=1077255 RepID=A0A2T5J1B8_9GAMM|nr:class 3 adenylate cyclase [Agitococcus lubricus]